MDKAKSIISIVTNKIIAFFKVIVLFFINIPKNIKRGINSIKNAIQTFFKVYIVPTSKAAASAVIWGSGQLLNGQPFKFIVFFIVQVIFVGIEFLTSKMFIWGSKLNVTIDKEIDFNHPREFGFFIRGVWGVITLGDRKSGTIAIPEPPFFEEIKGDYSNLLLLQGIIALIILIVFLIIFVWNIRDAFKTSLVYRQTGQKMSTKKYFSEIWKKNFVYLILSIPVFLLALISVMPILFGMLVAFTNYNKDHLPPNQLFDWVGFRNFRELFNLGANGNSGMNFGTPFRKVFTWTLIWTVLSSATCFIGGFIQALIINNKRVRFKKTWRTILILPWAVPSLITLLIFSVMFQQFGFVNATLIDLGFISERINWFGDVDNIPLARTMVVVLNIWLGYPYFMALLTGIMTSINRELYEAAEIDGASPFQQFRSITVPMVLYMTAPLLIMTVAANFNNFNVIYYLTKGGPGDSFETAYSGGTDLLVTWIYDLTVDQNIRMYNMASVFSILIFLIIGSISAWNFTQTRAFKEEDMM